MAHQYRRRSGLSGDLGASVVEVRLMMALILMIVLLVTVAIVAVVGRDYQNTCSELASTGMRAATVDKPERVVGVCRT